MGYSVASAGDVDGDGFDDVVAGAWMWNSGVTYPFEGEAVLYYGSPTGPGTVPGWQTSGGNWNAYYGCSVASAGDIDGDGFDDVLVGGEGWGNHEQGIAYLYLGSPGGLSSTASWSTSENVKRGAVGASVASAGDVDGDGLDDAVIGAPNTEPGLLSWFDAPTAYLFVGDPTGLSDSGWSPAAQAGSSFGSSVASAGDVDGDGYDDVVVGAPQYDDGQNNNVGAAFLYVGSAAGLSSDQV